MVFLLAAKVLDHNGYHTGDLGYRDEEGFLYLVGRKDGLLKVGGHRINPQEIEDVIMESELIVETAVIGIPDKLLGNKLVSLVVPIDKSTAAEQILEICAAKLPKYKLPSSVKVIRSLPKHPNGKIDRKKCKEMIEA
ncbi:MAG: acyl--CoA ligase [Spirochaetes bacterium]|nr:acyl--CoA ligase [Spirochaetota bacterium]